MPENMLKGDINITVSVSGTDRVTVGVSKPGLMEKYAEYEMISYNRAKEKLCSGEVYSGFYGKDPSAIDDEIAHCEIEYSIEGYYRFMAPYYKFYVKSMSEDYDMDSGIQAYDIYYVSACGALVCVPFVTDIDQ